MAAKIEQTCDPAESQKAKMAAAAEAASRNEEKEQDNPGMVKTYSLIRYTSPGVMHLFLMHNSSGTCAFRCIDHMQYIRISLPARQLACACSHNALGVYLFPCTCLYNRANKAAALPPAMWLFEPREQTHMHGSWSFLLFPSPSCCPCLPTLCRPMLNLHGSRRDFHFTGMNRM